MQQLDKAMPETYQFLDSLLKEKDASEFDYIVMQEDIKREMQHK
jgi:hypothetical protein